MVSARGVRISCCCCFQPENITLELEVTKLWTGSYSLEDERCHLVITAEMATSQALLPRSDLSGTPRMYPWHEQEQQTPPQSLHPTSSPDPTPHSWNPLYPYTPPHAHTPPHLRIPCHSSRKGMSSCHRAITFRCPG